MPKSETKPRARTTTDPAVSRAFAIESARLLADDKCEDVLVLDVRGISQITDFIVIGTGTSERQMRSTLSHLDDLGAEHGFNAFGTSDDSRATWLLADFVDVVVHVFEPNTRAHYDLEMLWGDSKRVPWERAAGAKREPAGKKSRS
jgi:ribosome-associated protein